MLNQISQEIKDIINNFQTKDSIIFKNKIIPINQNNFFPIIKDTNKSITFIDGGQTEILTTGNFCLSFIRIFAVTFHDNQRVKQQKNEFYLFTKAEWLDNDLYYKSKIYPLTQKLIDEEDLTISSNHETIKSGIERAPINKITNIARRFSELALAKQIDSDFILLDGTLDLTYQNEEKYLSENLSALAKTSSLFTTSGNNPTILLNNLTSLENWNYRVDETTSFVKLHSKSKHIFRFSGNKNVLPYLIGNSNDALFLGYPYGLIYADKMARVSNQEKKVLMTRFLLRKENKEIANYLHSSNAHDILDNLG